jgi:2-dehydropantoate 2-reductase
MRVAVIGAGAIGGYFAAQAERAGHEVLLCVRTPFDQLVLETAGETLKLGARVLVDPTREIEGGPARWVFLATKAHQTQAAAPWLRALCGDATRAVVVLQNGVEHEERTRPFVGGTPVLPATVLCAAEVLAPGQIRHHGFARLEVPAGPTAEALAQLFEHTPVEIVASDDMVTTLWHKLMLNITANPITALTGQRVRVVARPELRSLALGLVGECIAVARAEGARLELEDGVKTLEIYAAVDPSIGSSMLYDRMAGRALEYDALCGAVVRIGARHGIPTPFNEAVAGLLAVISDPSCRVPDA